MKTPPSRTPSARDPRADLILVDVEQPLLVEHLDGDRPLADLNHHGPSADGIGDLVVEARRVVAAAEQVAVPAAVAVAVLVRIAVVEVTGVLGVDVRLLVGELAGPLYVPV